MEIEDMSKGELKKEIKDTNYKIEHDKYPIDHKAGLSDNELKLIRLKNQLAEV